MWHCQRQEANTPWQWWQPKRAPSCTNSIAVFRFLAMPSLANMKIHAKSAREGKCPKWMARRMNFLVYFNFSAILCQRNTVVLLCHLVQIASFALLFLMLKLFLHLLFYLISLAPLNLLLSLLHYVHQFLRQLLYLLQQQCQLGCSNSVNCSKNASFCSCCCCSNRFCTSSRGIKITCTTREEKKTRSCCWFCCLFGRTCSRPPKCKFVSQRSSIRVGCSQKCFRIPGSTNQIPLGILICKSFKIQYQVCLWLHRFWTVIRFGKKIPASFSRISSSIFWPAPSGSAKIVRKFGKVGRRWTILLCVSDTEFLSHPPEAGNVHKRFLDKIFKRMKGKMMFASIGGSLFHFLSQLVTWTWTDNVCSAPKIVTIMLTWSKQMKMHDCFFIFLKNSANQSSKIQCLTWDTSLLCRQL